MLRSLFTFLSGMFGGMVAKLMIGAGLGLVSYAALSAAILTALAVTQSYFGGMTGAAAGIVLLMGFGEALSIIGTALLTKAAFASAGVAIGRTAAVGGA